MTQWRTYCRFAGLVFLLAAPPVGAQSHSSNPWLEIPDLQVRVEANEATILKASRVPFLNVHVGRQPQDVAYGKVTIRVNADVANVVATQRATEEGIICSLDLGRNPMLALRPGRNSVELIFKDRWNEMHYTSFMLQLPGDKPGARRLEKPGEVPYAAGRRFALVVGVGKYKFAGRGVPNLSYADSDAAAFRDFLSLPHGGNIPKEDVQYLLDDNATLENIKAALNRLTAEAEPQDTVVVYLNLNGAYDPADPDRKYLLAYDTDPADMPNTALPVADLPAIITTRLKHVFMIADTCHSREVGEAAKVNAKPDNLVNLYLARAFELAGLAALEASDVHQISHEGGQWGGAGVFTHYVMKGLAGAADANGDGTVTARELASYVQLHVSEDTLDEQLPIAGIGAAGNLALAGISTGRAGAAHASGE